MLILQMVDELSGERKTLGGEVIAEEALGR
jgi:hypothetical protein